MSDSRFPPIDPGPFYPAWPGPPLPRLSRPQLQQPPYTGGGGLSVPASAPQTFSLQNIASFQGTRVFQIDTFSQKVLDAPATYRNMLLIRNSSTTVTNIYVDFGADATIESAIILAQNEVIMFDSVVPQDDIYIIGDTAGLASILVSVISLPV